jgi:hypothetical protein
MKSVRIAAILLVLAQPAYAQMNLLGGGMEKPVTKEDVEKREAQEKAYRDSLKRIPDQQKANDPWGGVREAESSSASSKSKPKPR